MPCTTILVGKNATYDGSTMMARNEDSGSGNFTSKKFIVVQPCDQPKVYRSVLSKVEIPLPENPMQYTAMPNALLDKGIWGEAGINEANVAMSETETITSNPRVLGADPLVKEGIGEEDMLTLVLPYIHSAKEGVLRLGALLEQYGTYEMNGIGFQDKEEIWWLESIGGHHWMARRVPDDSYVVMPNQLGIDYLDFADAYGEQKENLCSKDLKDFVEQNFLDLDMDGLDELDTRAAFGSHSTSDHAYNTPRAWYMMRYLNPTTFTYDGPDAERKPEDDDLQWCIVPERKITIEDIKYVLSSYYQGTPYNPYDKHADPLAKGKYRPIGINRNNFLAITQLRPYVDEEIMGVEWISEGSNAFNTSVPFYSNVNDTPSYLRDTTGRVTTENFYWVNRIIGALVDSHYAKAMAHVERYELQTLAKGHNFLMAFDTLFKKKGEKSTQQFLEECNEQIAAYIKEETDQLLDKVLYEASMEMKNAFSKDDM